MKKGSQIKMILIKEIRGPKIYVLIDGVLNAFHINEIKRNREYNNLYQYPYKDIFDMLKKDYPEAFI